MRTSLFLLLFLPVWVFSQTEKGATPRATPPPSGGGRGEVRAVVIGISDYQDAAIPDLRFADRDAKAFANYLRSPAGGSLDADHLKVLLNDQATAGRIAEALDGLIEQAKEGDQVIIYFSGHGDVERKTVSQPGFLLCWDAPARVYMGGGTYSLAFLQEVVTTLSTQNLAKVIVITDACHAGKLAGNQIGGSQLTSANLARQYANEVKILSCQPNEFSLEGEQWGGGRGCFSYHLVDALYGLADGNNDLFVTLQEAGRYLEDHVSAEVAPVSQVPMVMGSRTERLAAVDAKLLADLRSGKTSQMLMLSPVASRGMEDDVLAGVDTTVRELYRLFKQALKDNVFLEPSQACADAYYERLMAAPKMQRLHTTMTRNYAAALQDDAQQAMNTWLAADVQQLECIVKTLRLDPIPLQLERAAELLGEVHYMYRSLQARKLLFEGILQMTHRNPDEALGRKCLSLFRQSLALEPQSPLPWHRMSMVYATNLRQPDSAFVCARQARNLAPNWVLPFADLGYALPQQNNLELAKQALEEATAIDPQHPYVVNRWANWLMVSDGSANLEKAAALFEQYRASDGPLYPCWFNDYSIVLTKLGRYAKSEAILKEAIALDSMYVSVWGNLGILYEHTKRYTEAEQHYEKGLALDSTNASAWGNLGRLYLLTNRDAEAETVLKKAVALDSTYANIWNLLGSVYLRNHRYAEAELPYLKAVGLDSSDVISWNQLGFSYIQTRRYAEAEPIFWRLVTWNANHLAGWNNLGNIYRETSRFEESEKMYRKAFEIDADFLPTYRNYAKLKAKTGDLQAAFSYLEQAIQKGYNDYQGMQTDPAFAPLREQTEQWQALMKKHFPDQVKD